MSNAKRKKIDELMERATHALTETEYFDAERLVMKALQLARQAGEFEQIARIALPLQEARRQRIILAFDACDEVTIVQQPVTEDTVIKPGCYIVQPMMVGADARRLRMKAFNDNVPVAVLCREPLSQMGLQPLVAIGEVTIRTKVRPPKNREQPSKEWFIDSMEALGDTALAEIDPALKNEKRIDAILHCLDAVPDHEKLHQALAEAARETARKLATAEA